MLSKLRDLWGSSGPMYKIGMTVGGIVVIAAIVLMIVTFVTGWHPLV